VSIEPVPDSPESNARDLLYSRPVAATPDLIIFDDAALPVEIMTDLLFEQLGGQEIINISRNDIINGQNVRYRLIANSGLLDQQYSSQNIFRVPGVLSEYFDNFGIKLSTHIPNNGTGPALFYVGEQGSNGCIGEFPVLNRYDDTLIECYTSYADAQKAIDQTLAPFRDLVYSDPDSGDIVVDVTAMGTNELVDIEIVIEGTFEKDTIY
jgi:hypothetical protein